MYNVYFEFTTGTWTEVEIELDSLSKTEVAYKGMKAEDSTCQFVLISNNTVYNALRLATESNVPCKVLKDSEPWFYGYIRKDFEFVETLRLRNTKIEIVSPSYYLKKKIGQDIHYSNITVSNLLTNLLVKAGVTVYTLPSITTAIPAFTVAYDDDTTYHETIYDLLMEYGYGFRFDEEGALVTFNLFPASIVSSHTFDKSTNTVGEIRQKNQEETYYETVINWTGVKTVTNAVIFKDTSNGSSVSECNIVVPKTSYYEFEEGETEYYAEYECEDGEILSASNITLDITKDSDISTVKFEPGYFKALLSFYNNNTTYDRSITKLNIIAGTAVVKSSDRQTKVVKIDSTEKVCEYDANYIFDKVSATNLANGLAWYYQCTDYTYQIASYDEVALNAIVTIQATGSILARVVERTTGKDGLYYYYLEAVSDYVAEVADSTITIPQPNPPLVSPSEVGTVVSNYIGTSGVVQNIVVGSGWTETPTIPTLSFIAQINSIILKWDKQTNLSNLDCYNIQVSEDASTWYSIGFDRSDFKSGVAGSYTTWQSEQCIHTLPLANGTTVSYYYRVRRVTRSGVMSDWSSVSVGSTTLLDNGSFSANEVYSNLVSSTALQAAIASISNSITINGQGFVGTTYDTANAPSENDRMLYLDKDELTITKYAPVTEPGLSVEKTFTVADPNCKDISIWRVYDEPNDSGFWMATRHIYLTTQDPDISERNYLYRMERDNTDTYHAASRVLIDETPRGSTEYVYYVGGIIVTGAAWTIRYNSTTATSDLIITDLTTGERLATIDLSQYSITISNAYGMPKMFVCDGTGVWISSCTTTVSNIIYIDASTYTVLASQTTTANFSPYGRYHVLDAGKVLCVGGYYYIVSYSAGAITLGARVQNSNSFYDWFPTDATKTKWIAALTTSGAYRGAYLTISDMTVTLTSITSVSDVRILGASGQSKLYQLDATTYYAYDKTLTGTGGYWYLWMKFTWDNASNTWTLESVVDLSTLLTFAPALPPTEIGDTFLFSNWMMQANRTPRATTYALFGYYGAWQEDLKIGGGSSRIACDTINCDSITGLITEATHAVSADSATTAGSAAKLTGAAYTNGSDGWFRTTGTAGWFNATYSGGIYMEDTTYVRAYNGKYLWGSRVYGAVGNDYADKLDIEHDNTTPGYCVSYKNGKTERTSKRNDSAVLGIVTDTASMIAGDGENRGQAIAVSGYVLAFVDKDYKTGTRLTVNKRGTLTKARVWEKKVATFIDKVMSEKWNGVVVGSRRLVKV